MKHLKIDLGKYPRKTGEVWWIVHPNVRGAEFRVPLGAVTVCTKDFEVFSKNTAYSIVGCDNNSGWITVSSGQDLYDMPQYIFARYFDAEVFVIGEYTQEEIEKAVPFDYKPTVPSGSGEKPTFCQFTQFKD